jgi:hypothetical protein
MRHYPHALVHYDADRIAGWVRESPAPDDDPQARVVLLSPELEASGLFEVIPTWSADTPAGSWIEVQLRARLGDRWSKPYRIAAWDSAPAASRRTSFASQEDADGQVATDTLLLAGPAEALQARVLLCASPGADMPDLESLALCLTDDRRPTTDDRSLSAIGYRLSAIELPLLLSQFLSFPGDEGWCSPTSLAMCLAYWHERTGDPRLAAFMHAASVPALAAPMIYDPAWDGTGNWGFNTAYAASLGLTAYVTRLHSLEQVSRWTAAGVPVICGLAWKPGELDGAPGTAVGHINLIAGFEGEHALMAEPSSRDLTQIRRRYRVDQLQTCWQRKSNGMVYLVYPPGYPRPEPGPGDAWM